MSTPPTQQEIDDAMREAKQYYGRRWRMDIWLAWMNDAFCGFPKEDVLLWLRNSPQHGPNWLLYVKIT